MILHFVRPDKVQYLIKYHKASGPFALIRPQTPDLPPVHFYIP